MARLRRAPVLIAQVGDVIAERDPERISGRLLRHAGMDSSYVDLADERHLEFDYMRWMRIVLRAARARLVLHVGGGACALARALAAENPESHQLVCEVDATVLTLAREHLGLRRAPGLRVRHAEGRAFIAHQAATSWDAIVIDAYVGAAIPRTLVTVEALADAARVAPLALINVVDTPAARELHAVASAVAAAYPRSWALGGRTGNFVVVGSRAPVRVPVQRISEQVASDRSPARLIRAP
jgi:spermidine synthase